jgi:hypothetical protein
MGLYYRLADYARYREAVGEATVIDISRRTDPGRIGAVWANLREVLAAHGAPWVVQVWTKSVGGVLDLGGDTLRALVDAGATVTAQVTVTGLAGSLWEPAVPTDSLARLGDLAEVLGGPDHLTWRYDPILPTVHAPETFARLAREVAAQGVTRAVINFVAPPGRYARVDRRLADLLPGWSDGMPGYDDAWRLAVARETVAAAREAGLRLACCAESAGLAAGVEGLHPAACGDGAWFAALSGRPAPAGRGRGSRPGCGCLRYFDVGNYGHWSRCHRCAYCYAG